MRIERRTPGSARGIRKPAALTRRRASDAHSPGCAIREEERQPSNAGSNLLLAATPTISTATNRNAMGKLLC